jgi:membrane-associated phospholipid phosphatase
LISIQRWVGGVGLGLLMLGASAGAQQPDSVRGPLFTTTDAWLTGGFAVGTALVWPLDESLARRTQLPGNQNDATLKNTATVFRNLADPGTVIIAGGLLVAGRLTHDRTMAAIGLHSGEAIAASGVVGWVIKSLAGRARPRVDINRPRDFKLGRGFGANGDYQSFPSGHTLAAFSLASAVTAESGRYWPREQRLVGVLTYTGATLSGLSRMYNNAHWASDVMLGAGIGTLSGIMAVRWNELHQNNWFDRTFLHLSAVPHAGGGVDVGFHAAW